MPVIPVGFVLVLVLVCTLCVCVVCLVCLCLGRRGVECVFVCNACIVCLVIVCRPSPLGMQLPSEEEVGFEVVLSASLEELYVPVVVDAWY